MHRTNGSGMVVVLGDFRKYWELQDHMLWDNNPVTTESDYCLLPQPTDYVSQT